MAKLHIAQIEYLSQELIDHISTAHNLMNRGTYELNRAQKTLKILLSIQEQWMSEMDPDSEKPTPFL
ncbi:MAG: hypothetical protein ACD_16C00075G0005 [uncultured bacterium]|nr:MAG: hypothetical protein ACD_16C00075G0005 [uncultured bacterium]OFW85320.1 MAG: hypothetical protein A2W06_04495 [Alphaproteobacteria bacterium RBG_16_42_14]HBG35008.1 hypothetical protein [Holosporales bacterium]HBW24860.1 hypothetical protein [Holosporales bacterium]HCE96200.1 hypothetical protein [Holosporales bacterium]